jgi:two-component system sensor histidine kinase DevS
MDVAFAPTPGSRAERWRALMRRLFDPLEIAAVAEAAGAPTLAANGLELLLPATAGSPALRLGYPWSGRGLFGPAHLALARHLVDLVGQAEASRTAYERGVTEERHRMAQDLHDDVGARLLSGLHTADDRTRPILHAAMADIRSIVTGLTGDHVPLDRVLADVRHECARRLEAAACTLNWPLAAEETPVLLDYRLHKALTSSVRELVTNVIRHANAKQLAVAVERDDACLVLTLSDDGVGLPRAARDGMATGQGLRGVARRMQGVGGAFAVDASGQGTAIRLEFPLRAP